MDELRHAFSTSPDAEDSGGELPEPLLRLARKVVELRMESAALIFLETVRPLSFLGSQVAYGASPFVKSLGLENFDDIARALEDRATVQKLIQEIERLSSLHDS